MACISASTTALCSAATLVSKNSTRASPARSAFAGKSLRRDVAQSTSQVRRSGVRATLDGGEGSSSKLVEDLKAKWDSIDDKTSVAVYGGGALVVVWLSSTVVSAVNSVPLLPQLLELVGTLYTGWFVYRYLLFKESRKELGELVEELKGKVTGKN